MLRLNNYDLQTNFSTKYVTKTTFEEVSYSDSQIIHRVENWLNLYLQSSRQRRFLDKELIVNGLRSLHPEYNRKPWGVLSNLVSRALVVLDSQKIDSESSPQSISSNECSTIDIMSSESEEIDMSNNLDPPQSSNNDITETDVNSSETAEKIGSNSFLCNLITNRNNYDSSNDVERLSGWVIDKTPMNVNNLKRKKKTNLNNTVEEMSTPMKKVCQELGTTEAVTVTFDDLAGCDTVLLDICQLVMHIKYPEVYKTLGVSPPKGFLLHGPPGCGKTLLAQAVAGELKLPLISIAAPQLVVGISGESEKRVRKLFETAVKSAPCVLFIDEVDSISPNRDNTSRDMERRIVAQLLSSLDSLKDDDKVIVIGATNRPDSLDPALRRAGRFDREVCLGIPDRQSRRAILDLMCKNLRIDPSVSLDKLSELTPGYVGADLKSLTREAATLAANRTIESIKKKLHDQISEVKLEPYATTERNTVKDSLNLLRADNIIAKEDLSEIYIELSDFNEALKKVVPSSKREGFVTVPNVTWDDIGSLKKIRQELHMAMLAPVTHAKEFTALGLDVPTGVLLCGPPGCGKTLLAKAVANEAGINFISIKGPELLNMYVGESERGVRQCFQRARNSQPCVIFFDEIDALCPKRSDMDANGRSGQRVVNQLLTEMDGFESGRSGGVFVMGATNRPDMIDPAVLRPGRLDKVLYVGLPDAEGRVDILKAVTKDRKRPVLADDVDLEKIGRNEKCSNFTGADLAALVREAGILCLQEYISLTDLNKKLAIQSKHFDEALLKIRPSVSAEVLLILNNTFKLL
ncbi:Hypothetical protein CINCED_3A019856 [Cinara cedri]|uniref:AAA+ ATPase domain-containing protein n=1 Tax=Cinara cedri TaxID=506608 RepID=A0A5E4MCS1_9HEMI|nr:Hypothetical protein CINCED_3A019856 [Cinara cedri]